MNRFLSLCLALSASFSTSTFAAPINLSLIGPVSSDSLFGSSETTNLCLGALHCGSENLAGLSISIGANTVQKAFRGVAIALAANVVQTDAKGLEISYLSNMNFGSFTGMQISGINFAFGESVNGLQAGFLANIGSAEVRGIQLSLLTNVQSNAVSGIQFSLLNAAFPGSEEKDEQKDKTGDFPLLQFGALNISTQSNTVPVGFLNFVKGGRFDLSLDTGVFGMNRLALNQGGKYFYTIITLDSSDLNPTKHDLLHRRRPFIRDLGFGLVYPINENINARLERIGHSPTYYERDSGTLWRLLAEYRLDNSYSVHAGVDHFRFKHNEWTRELSSSRVNVAVTAGVSLNLLGWWK